MVKNENFVIRRLWEKRLVRFAIVGCFNTVFDLSLLLVFYKIVGLSEIVANTFSVIIAISVSYFLNHNVVFRYQKKYSFKNYLRFLLITGISIVGIQDIVIYIVTHKLWVIAETRYLDVGGHMLQARTLELLAAKISAVFFGLIWNFLLYKYIVFPRQKSADEADEFVAV